MPDIRYVCLSDLHLGAQSSVLTHLTPDCRAADVHRPSPVLTRLVECLGSLVAANEDHSRKPHLVLCGDVFELALSLDNVAAMVFERFLDLVFPPGSDWLFSTLVYYVPGNHDHHLWEGARERQYARYVRKGDPGTDLAAPWHTTRLVAEADPDPVDSAFINALLRRRGLKDRVQVQAVYPNLGMKAAEGRRWAVFHHGHYVESMYRLMSKLGDALFPQRTTPVHVWDWEAENFAWIDFFWSALGRSADIGTEVGVVYDSLKSPKAMRRLADTLARSVSAHARWPLPVRWLAQCGMHLVVRKVADQERRMASQTLSPRTEKGLNLYLEGPVLDQLLHETTLEEPPEQLTFVFGHTHKPFSRRMAAKGFPEPLDVYNTGGWVVDTLQPEPCQGAAPVLLDEHLDAVSLGLYRQERDDRDYRVTVTQAAPGPPSELLRRVGELVDPDADPWAAFSREAAAAVAQRRHLLAQALSERG